MDVSFPTTIPVCLSKLSAWTGWGESTLREAAILGELKAEKKGGKWCATLNAYSEWVAPGKRGRDVGATAVEEVAASGGASRTSDQRSGQTDQSRSQGGVGKQVRKTKRSKPTLVLHLCEDVAEPASG